MTQVYRFKSGPSEFLFEMNDHLTNCSTFDFGPVWKCSKFQFWSTFKLFKSSILIHFQIVRTFNFGPLSNFSKFRFRFSLNSRRWGPGGTLWGLVNQNSKNLKSHDHQFRGKIRIDQNRSAMYIRHVTTSEPKSGPRVLLITISTCGFLPVMKFQSLKMLLTFNINKLTKSL